MDEVAATQLDDSSEDEAPVTPVTRKRHGGVLDTPCKRTKVAQLGRSSPRLRELKQRAAVAKIQVEVQPLPEPILPRHRRTLLALSGVELQALHVQKLRAMGGQITKTWSPQVTHLVASRLRRTFKTMCAICKGLPIVRPSFVARCAQLGFVPEVDPKDLLRDRVGEKIWASRFSSTSYNLADALVEAQRQGPLLQKFHVYISPEEKGMDRSKLHALVSAAGGTWLEELADVGHEATGQVLIFGPVKRKSTLDLEALFEAACTQSLEGLKVTADLTHRAEEKRSKMASFPIENSSARGKRKNFGATFEGK